VREKGEPIVILIKDMKMPKWCPGCPLYDNEYGWCKTNKDIVINFDERPSNCPLIESADSDPVSRQAALDAIRSLQTYKLSAGDDMLLVDKADVQTELMMLPSAQPKTEERTAESSQKVPKEDLISRKTAIEALFDWEMKYDWDDRCRKENPKPEYIVSPSDVIEKLPSAQPVITCDGCRFVGTYDTDFPCCSCIRREKDYYEPER
jgi:hypothetical protein